MSATLRVMNLTKNFVSCCAVNNISFSAVAGEVVGFLGPNGAGKTTTMKMISGFMRPSAGTAFINGYDIVEQPIHAKANLGYLPEGNPLYADMTVEKFLKFIADIRGVNNTAVDTLNLKPVLHKKINDLSKGYKKRVGLAQALLHDPDVLILDEPTDGLDIVQKREMHRLIKDLAQDKVILLSTHLLDEVEQICDRVIVINAGHIRMDSTPQRNTIEEMFVVTEEEEYA